jgi:hypothetical protein
MHFDLIKMVSPLEGKTERLVFSANTKFRGWPPPQRENGSIHGQTKPALSEKAKLLGFKGTFFFLMIKGM